MTQRFWTPWLAVAWAAAAGGCSASGGQDDGGQPEPGVVECLVDPGCDRILVAAHRGYHLEFQENSLAALRAAAEVGAAFVEVDVRHTVDEILVLMHDGDVDRTTDGTGPVDQMTWEQIRQLRLDGGSEEVPETSRVPLFAESLGLAEELGIMLYVDVKTERTDLLLTEIQSGPYHDVALVRDDVFNLAPLHDQDPDLLVMPPISTLIELEIAQTAVDDLVIVEYAEAGARPDLVAAARAAGVKVQQDVMALGDTLAMVGDYTGWKAFVEAGVFLLQTDYPHLLVPALDAYARTGVFPVEGPGVY